MATPHLMFALGSCKLQPRVKQCRMEHIFRLELINMPIKMLI